MKRSPIKGTAKLLKIQGRQILKLATARVAKFYVLCRLAPHTKVATIAWQLESSDGRVYHVAVDAHGAWCDCPDGVYNKGPDPCKHIKGLRAVELIP